MITVKDTRLLVDRLLKREAVGNTIGGNDFNRFLSIANANEVDNLKRKAEVSQDVTDSLRHLITQTDTFASSGVFSLPTNYLKLQSVERFDGVSYNEADVVTVMEYKKRVGNSITGPTTDIPIAYIEGDNVRVLPSTNANVRYIYLRKPLTPYLDYYINTSGLLVYLNAGDVVASDQIDSDFLLYGADGQPLIIVGGNYTSKTVEFDWADEGTVVNIIHRLLILAGITAPSQLSVEIGMQEVNKKEIQL